MIHENTARWPTWALRRNWRATKPTTLSQRIGIVETLNINRIQEYGRGVGKPKRKSKDIYLWCESMVNTYPSLLPPIAFPKNTHFHRIITGNYQE